MVKETEEDETYPGYDDGDVVVPEDDQEEIHHLDFPVSGARRFILDSKLIRMLLIDYVPETCCTF